MANAWLVPSYPTALNSIPFYRLGTSLLMPPTPRSPAFEVETLANGPHRLSRLEREAQEAREVAQEIGDPGDERVLDPRGCDLHNRHGQDAGEFGDEMPGFLIPESEMPEMAQRKIRAVFEAEPDVEPILPR